MSNSLFRNSIVLVHTFLPLCGTVYSPGTVKTKEQAIQFTSTWQKTYPSLKDRFPGTLRKILPHHTGTTREHKNSWPHSREKIHCILTSGTEICSWVWSQALFKPSFKEKWQKINAGSAIESYQRAEGCPARRGTGVYSMKPDRQRKGRWSVQKSQPHN